LPAEKNESGRERQQRATMGSQQATVVLLLLAFVVRVVVFDSIAIRIHAVANQING